MFKLAVSNIGFVAEQDEYVYSLMQKYGFCGLEIAPTRIFPDSPYDRLLEAQKWSEELKEKSGFSVPSMQSIWYGRSENIFESLEQRNVLVEYTKKAIDFARVCNCSNLVFGCPRNRNVPEGKNQADAIAFFKELGDYAYDNCTVIGMEANPPIYNTNFINGTQAALELVEKVDSKGFKLNLDLGTMIYNGEEISLLARKVDKINHVHISEPGLKPIERRKLHQELKELLIDEDYKGFVSIEMGKTDNIKELEAAIEYVSQLFN